MSTITTNEYYTPGHTRCATAFMAERSMETHAFYLHSYLQPDFNVLDVGCGPGTISADIAEAVFPGQVTAVDISSSQLEYGRRLSQGRELVNIRFIHATAYQLPFADRNFDLVFAHSLLEHLNNPIAVLREFYRITMPGGFAVISSPDWEAFEENTFPDEVRDAFQTYRLLHRRNGGQHNAAEALPQWLQNAGFKPIETNEWHEQRSCLHAFCEHFALQLEHFNFTKESAILREWSQTPDTSVNQFWKYAIGTKPERY